MTISIRRGLLAAVSAFVLTLSFTPAIHAQQTTARAANTELAAKGVWDPTTSYVRDDIVTARGSAWIAKRNNTNRVPGQTDPSTANDWQLFARGFNPTGAWKGNVKYQPDDLVTRNGQTWRAKLTNKGAIPTDPVNATFWEVFAAKGDPGPNTGIADGSQSAPSISFANDHDTGIYSPSTGKIALVSNGDLFLHNLGTQNTALGLYALKDNTTGAHNVALGGFALHLSSTGSHNTAIGSNALGGNTSGSYNTAVGKFALGGVLPMTGDGNTAIGQHALYSNGSGNNNIAVGRNAGHNPTFSSNSIFIGNTGTSGDTATIKIGTQGTQESAFIAGIRGVTTGVNDAVAVMVDSAGQLGVTSSSRRYKHDIEAMADVSTMLAKLRPVTFRYNKAQNDGAHPLQYGLIAEEVAEVFPGLAVFNKDGSAETVKYHLLPSFLLAGYQAQQNTIATQADEIAELKQRLAAIEALLPRTMKAAAR